MHQKIIISFSFAFAVAILSLFGSIILNKVSATSDTFALPSGGPASFQIPAPINVSQSNQTKTGGITLGKDLWIRPSISSSQKSGILLFSKNESQGLPGYIYNDKGALKYQTLSSNNPNTASYTTVFEVDKGGNTNISGNLTVNKQTKLNSNTDISGNLTVSGNINTTGTLTTQNLKVNGDTTFTNLNVNNQLKLSGETVLTGSSQIPWGNITGNVPWSRIDNRPALKLASCIGGQVGMNQSLPSCNPNCGSGWTKISDPVLTGINTDVYSLGFGNFVSQKFGTFTVICEQAK